MPTACPHCNHPLTRKQIGELMGGIKSEAKARSSRRNGKLGGRPPKKGNKH